MTNDSAPKEVSKSLRFLIWGSKGWIGSQLVTLLKQDGKDVLRASSRMENRESVMEELTDIKPTHVINAAGCTGRPNIDWCEDNKELTVRSNVIGALNLADCCAILNIHLTVFATGCLYEYDAVHPIGGPGYKEGDEHNFKGSFYSLTKGYAESLMKQYDNCLILRLRMPVSDDLHERSFLTKIINYEKVIDVPNSHSILHDLLPAAQLLAENNETGIFNFTNPGAISHNQVLDLFKEIVRPSLAYSNFEVHEYAALGKAGRSNCELDNSKLIKTLERYDYNVPEIHQAYRECFNRMLKHGIK